uniref:DUF2249 domain-containing protein n=1 Tax=Pedobacter schmidteae TaxID=2201271 RepID=UPI0013CED322|nr:DUF2249 domain-containing protein [Pedobacter schmidteae]
MNNKGAVAIDRNTRIKKLLDVDQTAVIEALVQLNANFSKLRHPVLRKLFAGRVSISDACRIAGCEVAKFLNTMKQIGFDVEEAPGKDATLKNSRIDFSLQTKVLELDARPYLEKNTDPLKEILVLARQLRKGERLKIISSFEPVPLISLLNDQGFRSYTDKAEPDLFITWFERIVDDDGLEALDPEPADAVEKEIFELILHRFKPEKIKYLDVRTLPMPQPMLSIIAIADKLGPKELLYVYHKKNPVFLLEELERLGLTLIQHQYSADRLDLLIYKA